MSVSPVCIRNTELHLLQSGFIDQEYHVSVHLPRSYGQSDTNYPVLYMPDADQFFGMVTDIAQLLRHRDGVPEQIIVGIGYGSDVGQHFNERMRDLMPSNIPQFPTSGGGEQFRRFIVESVVPFIESNYQADPADRTYLGVSAGGLLGLYLLFRNAGLFHKFIISSPSVSWDDGYIFGVEEAFAQDHDDLAARMFLSVGGLEDYDDVIAPVQRMAETLSSRDYASLDLITAEFEGETHFSVNPAAVARGLKAVLAT